MRHLFCILNCPGVRWQGPQDTRCQPYGHGFTLCYTLSLSLSLSEVAVQELFLSGDMGSGNS